MRDKDARALEGHVDALRTCKPSGREAKLKDARAPLESCSSLLCGLTVRPPGEGLGGQEEAMGREGGEGGRGGLDGAGKLRERGAHEGAEGPGAQGSARGPRGAQDRPETCIQTAR